MSEGKTPTIRPDHFAYFAQEAWEVTDGGSMNEEEFMKAVGHYAGMENPAEWMDFFVRNCEAEPEESKVSRPAAEFGAFAMGLVIGRKIANGAMPSDKQMSEFMQGQVEETLEAWSEEIEEIRQQLDEGQRAAFDARLDQMRGGGEEE